MANAGAMQVLLLTGDPWLISTFTEVSRELGIEAQAGPDLTNFDDGIYHIKYDALLVDFDTVSDNLPMIANVRKSPSNRNAVVFAVATDAAQKQEALHQGANLVFERPFASQEIRRALYAAYSQMVGERRRYFRCSAKLPALLVLSSLGSTLQGMTMNVSTGGMAVEHSSALNPGDALYLSLTLPDGFTVRATGTVIWDDKHGKSGISFQCSGHEMQRRLDSWLDSQFSSEGTLR